MGCAIGKRNKGGKCKGNCKKNEERVQYLMAMKKEEMKILAEKKKKKKSKKKAVSCR